MTPLDQRLLRWFEEATGYPREVTCWAIMAGRRLALGAHIGAFIMTVQAAIRRFRASLARPIFPSFSGCKQAPAGGRLTGIAARVLWMAKSEGPWMTSACRW